MLTSKEIIERIVQRIWEYYAAPPLTNASQLDAALYELHLLYAEATEQNHVWVEMRKRELADLPDWHEKLRKSEIETQTPELWSVVHFWKGFSTAFGMDRELNRITEIRDSN